MKFYNVRKKQTVEIADSKCVKMVYEKQVKKGTVRATYGVTAVDTDGTKLAKFLSKDTFDKLKCPRG